MLELMLFLKRAREKMPWIKRALWFVEDASGRVEIEPLFEEIDAATAKFSDALPILEKRQRERIARKSTEHEISPSTEKPKSNRRRHCASSYCATQEPVPGTFRCCVQCQADQSSPRKFYCSEDCFVDDWRLVHFKFHAARKREGIDEATKRRVLLREHGLEEDEGDERE